MRTHFQVLLSRMTCGCGPASHGPKTCRAVPGVFKQANEQCGGSSTQLGRRTPSARSRAYHIRRFGVRGAVARLPHAELR
eukprot:8746437-Alexandrium_andersonii.AAC.1